MPAGRFVLRPLSPWFVGSIVFLCVGRVGGNSSTGSIYLLPIINMDKFSAVRTKFD